MPTQHGFGQALASTFFVFRRTVLVFPSHMEEEEEDILYYPRSQLRNKTVATSKNKRSRAGGYPPRHSSILNNSKNSNIHDNMFVINNKAGTTPSLDVLYQRAAPNAILNAGGHADEVRSHPGTRVEVIGRIEKWRDAQDGLQAPIFWLSGPAGAGKTAIVQTIAENCKAQGVPQANFFFFRTDASRNTLSPLVATLLHQIIQLYPLMEKAVAAVLSSNPLILDSILEEQLEKLVVTPLRTIQELTLAYRPPLLLIDGLDECDSNSKRDQLKILHAFDKVFAAHPSLISLLVASRDESQIKTAFNAMASSVFPLYLDDRYSPEHDIRLFVDAQFEQVRKTHPLAHLLDATWPAVADVDEIVEKSSGQFIYAATVMRFISDSSASPELSLERVQGAAQLATKSPFLFLDAIYTYILSQADDQQALKDVLHAHFWRLGGDMTIQETLSILDHRYTNGVIHSCIADMTAIARFENEKLIFYHASLTDFFHDQLRSGEYFADLDMFDLKILPPLLEHSHADYRVEYIAIHCLAILKTMTLEIMRAKNIVNGHYLGFRIIPLAIFIPLHNLRYITMAQIEQLHGDTAEDGDVVVDALRPEASDADETTEWVKNLLWHIRGKYYPHNLEKYKRLIKQWIFWAFSNNLVLPNLDDLPNYPRVDDTSSSSSSKTEVHGLPCSQRYITMARIEQLHRDTTRDHKIVVNALRPESASDADEIAMWLQNVLQLIHGEYYSQRLGIYKHLIRQWIFWAVLNDIALADLSNLPYGQRYFWLGTLAKWITSHFTPSEGT
ncbi:hypothetical protein D9619_011267 [Psilocybe cf. subviscida]|uniref:NACHT domain-containing protein n=1 Tax=Psilocybe cf. subviscida TaxID=2480587 RepID=A0A8H5F5L2_9AGAR|nr:hypothetical protein D9619_011267 [Psilocybe cf. subviscida]